jgi:putative transposase
MALRLSSSRTKRSWPNSPAGTVKPSALAGKLSRVGQEDASSTQASQPVPLLQRFPLSLRNVEDLLFERGIDICHETVRLWWNRFGPMFAGEVRRKRVSRMREFRQWRWHLDEMYVKLNGEMVYVWRAVDQEGEILESFVTETRDKQAALTFMKKALKRHGSPEAITTDGLRSYGAAMNELGNREKQAIGRWVNNRVENSHLPFDDESARCSGSGR